MNTLLLLSICLVSVQSFVAHQHLTRHLKSGCFPHSHIKGSHRITLDRTTIRRSCVILTTFAATFLHLSDNNELKKCWKGEKPGRRRPRPSGKRQVPWTTQTNIRFFSSLIQRFKMVADRMISSVYDHKMSGCMVSGARVRCQLEWLILLSAAPLPNPMEWRVIYRR